MGYHKIFRFPVENKQHHIVVESAAVKEPKRISAEKPLSITA